MINVSWCQATAYIHWLNSQLHLAGGHDRYRLPSEAEWEYAARGYTQLGDPHNTYTWEPSLGDPTCDRNALNGAAWGGCPNPRTFPVGSFQRNRFGLYDMLGNAYEWVQDCYRRHYDRSKHDGAPIELSNCPLRVMRGGSWEGDNKRLIWVARRGKGHPSVTTYEFAGFRVARTL